MQITDKKPFVQPAPCAAERLQKYERMKSPGGTGKNPSANDDVSFSPEVRLFREALKQMDKVPEIREDLVARFREEIGRGAYRMDGGVVADKMVGDLLADAFLSP